MAPFEKVRGNFGFGFMRLPMNGEEVDYERVCEMVDRFMEAGFNYFDTAHGYIDGKSEIALKKCLTSRYPRESYVIANKLSTNFFKKEEDILPVFESQLEATGVDYFDFYLMHSQNERLFLKYKSAKAYEIAARLKEEGRIKHLAISFHDSAAVLDNILTEYPIIEAVQIQLNYIDFDDPCVEAEKCYEVCRRHGKPIIVMEPVKGGCLVNLPPDARAVFDELGGSPASYAIRFAAGFEGVFMVLSGMGSIDMVRENVSFMKDFKPLDERERDAVQRVRSILRGKALVQCTNCRYCVSECPKGIPIPNFFTSINERRLFNSWQAESFYIVSSRKAGAKAEDCIECGACEDICPQKLPIRELLKEVSREFDKREN